MDSDISFLFCWPHEIIHKACASWVNLRSNHHNTGPLNARFIWIPDTLGVQYSNGLTWPNIWILNIFDHKQAFFRPEFRKPFEDWTIWKPDTKLPFQDWTSLVFRWLLFWQSLKAKICPTWFREDLEKELKLLILHASLIILVVTGGVLISRTRPIHQRINKNLLSISVF